MIVFVQGYRLTNENFKAKPIPQIINQITPPSFHFAARDDCEVPVMVNLHPLLFLFGNNYRNLDMINMDHQPPLRKKRIGDFGVIITYYALNNFSHNVSLLLCPVRRFLQA